MIHILDQNLQSDSRVSTMINGVAHYFFDFYSLDVEGAEVSVLKSIDWNRTSFGIVFMERPNGNPDAQSEILEIMIRQQGYEEMSAGVSKGSLWFKHPDFDKIYSKADKV